jgi:hypothetical protein
MPGQGKVVACGRKQASETKQANFGKFRASRAAAASVEGGRISRRHLDESQRAMVAARIANLRVILTYRRRSGDKE